MTVNCMWWTAESINHSQNQFYTTVSDLGILNNI